MIGLTRVLLRRVSREVGLFIWGAFMVDVSLNFSGILVFLLLLSNLDLSHSPSPPHLLPLPSALASQPHPLEVDKANTIFRQQV